MVQTRWKAESRAIKRRKESKDKKPYDRNIDSRSSAVMRNDIFRVDNKETVRQYIITLDTVTNNYPRIWTGQDSTFPSLRCASTVLAWVTSPPSVLTNFSKEQAECRCQRQPSQTRRQTRKPSRQDEQLQEDLVSIS